VGIHSSRSESLCVLAVCVQLESVRHTFMEERSRWEARLRQEVEQEQQRHHEGG
jgi:hypothetical protein